MVEQYLLQLGSRIVDVNDHRAEPVHPGAGWVVREHDLHLWPVSPWGNEGRINRHVEPSRILYLLHHALERDMFNSFDLELAYELAEVNLIEIDVLENLGPPVYWRVTLGQRLPVAVEQGAVPR